MHRGLQALSIICMVAAGPALAETATERGMAAAKQGQWKTAVRSFTEAWRSKPLSPNLLYNLGLAHAKSGNNVAAIAWFEAYLSAAPRSRDNAAIRQTIKKLEVSSEASVDALFNRQLSVIEKAPHDEGFNWSSGKHALAMIVADNMVAVGRLTEARETRDLAESYAREKGGTIFKKEGDLIHRHVGRTDKELHEDYARALAHAGRFEEAEGYVAEPYAHGWSYVFEDPYASTHEVKLALRKSTYNDRVIAKLARSLWVRGNVDGLRALAAWLIDKDGDYYPAMVEVGHGLLGLGYKKEAAKFAKALTKAHNNSPAARFAIRLLYQNPDIMPLNCYERVVGTSTLWRMLDTQFRALKGGEKVKAHTSIPLYQWERKNKPPMPLQMKLHHAWATAFEAYANGNIDKAKSTLRAAEHDDTSFLIIALRNAALIDPAYAAKIADEIDPSYLAPFVLYEAALQASQRKDAKRANVLMSSARKRVKRLGGNERVLDKATAFQRWVYLAMFFSNDTILSNFPATLKKIAGRQGISFDPFYRLQHLPFVETDQYYECPSLAGPSAVPAVEAKPRRKFWDLSNAAARLGKALMYVYGARARTMTR